MALPLLELSRVSLLLQRLHSLPVWPVEWELAICREGRWATPAGRAAYRPQRVVCCPRGLACTGLSDAFEPGEPPLAPVLEAFLWLQRSFGPNQHLPELLVVRDAALAAQLEPCLVPLGVGVLVVDELPGVELERFELLRDTHGGASARRSFGHKVSVARIRSFAIAAAEFFDAAPWQHVGESEQVVVLSPQAPLEAFSSFHVLGALGPSRGIDFAITAADHRECHAARVRM